MSIVNAVMSKLSSLNFEYDDIDGSNGKPNFAESETLETAEKLRVFLSLPIIGKKLGPAECQSTLIPMLGDLVQKAINSGDDEVLMVISQKLPELTDVLGFEEEGASSLIPVITDILVCVEEIVVAQAVADAFCAIISHFTSEQIEKKALPLIRKIQEEDLFCTSRKVVSKMIIACYPLTSLKLQSELKYRLIHICDNEEEVPLVRAAAIQSLVDLCTHIGPDIKTELAPVLLSLVTDCQRTVRAACVAPLLALGRLLTDSSEFESMIQTCLDKLAEDGSRDTRRALACTMADLQSVAVKVAGPNRSLHLMMMNLLEDNEVETRRVAASQLREFCLTSPPEILTEFLLPRLQEHLSMEREERVRSELVCCAVSLLPSVQRDDCLPLVRPILAFLNHNMDQPKQYVFEYFSELMALMPANEIQLTLLPSLINLWQGKNWRVRLGVVQSIPHLFNKLPETCLRETILPSTLAWLRDPTWAVRDCACRSLARLLRVCPSAAKDAIMGTNSPSLLPVSANQSSSTTTMASSTLPSTPSQAIGASLPTTQGISSSISSSISVVDSNCAGSSLPAPALSGSGSTVGGSLVEGMPTSFGMSIANITALAASKGLISLATDTNYHLRQIFILAVQNIWGPGIPDDPPYSAFGEISPHIGILSPASSTLYNFVSSNQTASSQVIPANCSQPPTMPSSTLQPCLHHLLHLLSEDPVPNVRFAAARALLIISGNVDKQPAQKMIIPTLTKVVDEDQDSDVRFFAKETLAVLKLA